MDVAGIAAGIAKDIAARRTFRLSEGLDGMGMEKAYALQDALTALRGGPEVVGGYKLAFNSAGSQAYYKLAEGCIAPVYRCDLRKNGAILRRADFHSLAIEPEICLELGADLEYRPGLTVSEAMAAVAAICPAVEVMDLRGAFDLDPSAAQAVAQGIYSAGAVLGARLTPDRLAARHGVEARLHIGGAVAGSGFDSAPQDPGEGLVWAAGALARRGLQLRAGMILLCGTLLPVREITTPGQVLAEMGAFGSVNFTVV